MLGVGLARLRRPGGERHPGRRAAPGRCPSRIRGAGRRCSGSRRAATRGCRPGPRRPGRRRRAGLACSAVNQAIASCGRGRFADDDPGPGRDQGERVEVRFHQQRSSVSTCAGSGRGHDARPRRGRPGCRVPGPVRRRRHAAGRGRRTGRGMARRAGARGSARPAARGPGRGGSRPGWPRPAARCPGRGARPAAGTAGPQLRSGADRSRRAPPGRWPAGHQQSATRPAVRGRGRARPPASPSGSSGWSRLAPR